MIPINRLKKKELVYLATHKCKHSHLYISHYQCYLKEERKPGERIGFLDIEACDLSANFGYVFSWCIKPNGGKIIQSVITERELKKSFDKEVVRRCIAEMRKYDRIVTYYGKNYRYDIPYLRSRALHHGLDFPVYSELKTTDCYDLVKGKLKLHSNRMQVACDFLGIPSKKHKLDLGERKFRAMWWDKKALKWVLEHNREDVISLEKLYNKLVVFGRITDTSL